MELPNRVALLFFAFLLAPLAVAHAASVSELLDAPLKDLRGETAGRLEEVIVDVRAGHVAYLILEGPSGYHTLPARALDERLRVDMSLDDRTAALREGTDPRYRRARRLIGEPVGYRGAEPVGKLADIEFAPKTGRVERVMVATPQGERPAPASLLAEGARPLTHSMEEVPPPADGAASRGSQGRGIRPSSERTTIVDHQWDRFGRSPR